MSPMRKLHWRLLPTGENEKTILCILGSRTFSHSLGHLQTLSPTIAMSALSSIVLQNGFWITEDEFSGLRARRAIIVWGTIATNDELTGNFGSALENTSIGDCRLTALFAEKSLQAIFGVLQHYLPSTEVANLIRSPRGRGRATSRRFSGANEPHGAIFIHIAGCPCRKSNPNILVV